MGKYTPLRERGRGLEALEVEEENGGFKRRESNLERIHEEWKKRKEERKNQFSKDLVVDTGKDWRKNYERRERECENNYEKNMKITKITKNSRKMKIYKNTKDTKKQKNFQKLKNTQKMKKLRKKNHF